MRAKPPPQPSCAKQAITGVKGMQSLPSHYRTLPDGRIQDLRYRYRRGTLVRVVSGPHRGLTGRVESPTFDRQVSQPAYHAQLSGGKWVQVRRDELESVPS